MDPILELFPGFEEYKQLDKIYDPVDIQWINNLSKGHIWIKGDISFDTLEFYIRYLQNLGRTSPPTTIHFFSYGGELDAMFCMYDAIRSAVQRGAHITTVNEGACHSAAFIIFLAADMRIMRPNAAFIAHEGSATLGGTFRETKQAAKRYEEQVRIMADIISERTGLPRKVIDTRYSVDSDWYITYQEARNMNIITQD